MQMGYILEKLNTSANYMHMALQNYDQLEEAGLIPKDVSTRHELYYAFVHVLVTLCAMHGVLEVVGWASDEAALVKRLLTLDPPDFREWLARIEKNGEIAMNHYCDYVPEKQSP